MKKRDFTLVELLVVVVILGVLLAVLWPSLRHAKDFAKGYHGTIKSAILTLSTILSLTAALFVIYYRFYIP